MPLLNIVPNSPEWFEYRKGKIGASLAPIIMGISPWRTPYQLWEEMLEITPPQEQNDVMKRGLDLENTVREIFMEKKECFIFPVVYESNSHNWMFATLDGYSPDGKFIVEIKCPGKKDHDTALNNIVPEKYFPQLQHQLAVTGAEKMFYASYDGVNKDIPIIEVYRDEKYIAKLIEKEMEFLRRVRTFDPPELTEKDVANREDDEWKFHSEIYKGLLEKQAFLEKEIEEAKSMLLELANGKNTYGYGVNITKVSRKGSVEYSKIPVLKGLDLEQYRKAPSLYWRITAA